MASSVASPQQVALPFDSVAKFVRQLSHDVRNNLGSIDLQAAFLAELITDPEAAAELRKLRGMVTSAARTLQQVSANFWVAKLNAIPLPARMFIEDFRERLGRQHPEESAAMQWDVALGEETLSVDVEMMFVALAEICRNTFHFHETTQPIAARAFAETGRLVFELRQKRTTIDSAPETWGTTPLVSTRRGGYGLGLYHARQVVAAHGGDIMFVHDSESGTLLTRVTLPLGSAA